ncbi:hypothetical protein CVT26_003055 [Gymnopilus dilepis]|uniref:Uncharacterized protein n=1 Tax=Gymnopilus dilepis TaxID=231916 RepID=A0A409Y4S7_9AGAR|nr:hypothetical protein CVT26_003055 [Gymnopilus dilepis]
MQFKLFKLALVFASFQAMTAVAEEPVTVTAKKVYNTLIDHSPFMVQRTTTVVWTQTPSSTSSQAQVSPTPSKVTA